MESDFVAELGYLCLGSRFRRIGERLQASVAELCRRQGLSVQAAHLPLLEALARSPLSIGHLADRLRLSQPAVTRSIGALVDDGLVAQGSALDDRRVKVLSLTEEGRRVVEICRRTIYPVVERAVADIVDGKSAGLLEHLDDLDQALAARSLDECAVDLDRSQ